MTPISGQDGDHKRHHHADIGVNWYSLQRNAEDLFGDAPETAPEQKQK